MTSAELGIVVVPCYNEARRIDPARFAELTDAGLEVMFVDDGSIDDTISVLRSISEADAGATFLALEHNRGKGEAVRAGLRRALQRGAPIVGYLDADLSTPPGEYLALARTLLNRTDLEACLGARVALLDREINRRAWRHYVGRVFATGASIALGVSVYDTQCGAKVFKRSTALEEALSTPFQSRWAFDVELLQRLLDHGGPGTRPYAIREMPLESWSDVDGSKLGLRAMAQAGLDLGRIWFTRMPKRRPQGSGAVRKARFLPIRRPPAPEIVGSGPPQAPNAPVRPETRESETPEPRNVGS